MAVSEHFFNFERNMRAIERLRVNENKRRRSLLANLQTKYSKSHHAFAHIRLLARTSENKCYKKQPSHANIETHANKKKSDSPLL